MTLCIDIGNTNICAALGTKESYHTALVYSYEIYDDDSFAAFYRRHFGNNMFKRCIISSVVPDKTAELMRSIKKLNKYADIDSVNFTKMDIDFTGYKSQLGEDRAVCAAMAVKKYSAPAIVVDCGTATTINVVDENSFFLGGAILAGVQTGLDALANVTARLPKIELADLPNNNIPGIKLIGSDTLECIISGIIISTACGIEGYVKRIAAEFHPAKPKIIITGGHAPKIIPHCGIEFIHEPNLLIEGLLSLYEDA